VQIIIRGMMKWGEEVLDDVIWIELPPDTLKG